jgi:hypothetical protein
MRSSVCNGRNQGNACKRYGKIKAEMRIVKRCQFNFIGCDNSWLKNFSLIRHRIGTIPAAMTPESSLTPE